MLNSILLEINTATPILCKEQDRECFMFPSNVIVADKFVKQAQAVHGAKYDYGMVLNRESLAEHSPNYLNIDAPVFIRCLFHGEFMESPRHHLEGRGCPSCYMDKNVDAIKAALYEHKIVAEKDFMFPGVSWRLNYDLFLPDYNVIIQFHSLEHTQPFLEYGGNEHLRLIKEGDVMRDALAREMRVKVIYITSKHLRDMNREQLGDYIVNILNVYKHGADYKNK